MYLTEETLAFVAKIIHGKLRIYDEGYAIDVFKGYQHYFSLTFTKEGKIDTIDEWKIPWRKKFRSRNKDA